MQSHLQFTGYLGRRLHLGVSGSIAAYKALELMRMIQSSGAAVSATLTASAQKFVASLSFEALGAAPVYGDMFAGDALFGHLEPGQVAHAMLVAPATANTLAKLAHGLADDMLSAQALAFPGPLVVAPAMNPRLWSAAATRANWELLRSRGVVCIEPDSGDMACGEEGRGRFPVLEAVYCPTMKALTNQDLAGRRILVTLGPTREYFDCVRFWSNPSSGAMGAALVMAAWLRGAEVTAVCGPADLWFPEGVRRVDVTSAVQMHEACMDVRADMDAACCSAAVADYRPAATVEGKFKKGAGGMDVTFDANPDILRDLGAHKAEGQYLIGFAAESDDLQANALGKLQRKNLDMIVANDVTAEGCGFARPTNGVTVLDAHGRVETWPVLPKTEVAWRIWDWMLGL